MKTAVWQGFDHYWAMDPHRLNVFGSHIHAGEDAAGEHNVIYHSRMSIGRFPPDECRTSTIVHEVPPVAEGVRCYGVPFTEIALGLGRRILKNVVSLGALQAATQIFPEQTFLAAFEQGLKADEKIQEANREAFRQGAAAFHQLYAPAEV